MLQQKERRNELWTGGLLLYPDGDGAEIRHYNFITLNDYYDRVGSFWGRGYRYDKIIAVADRPDDLVEYAYQHGIKITKIYGYTPDEYYDLIGIPKPNFIV